MLFTTLITSLYAVYGSVIPENKTSLMETHGEEPLVKIGSETTINHDGGSRIVSDVEVHPINKDASGQIGPKGDTGPAGQKGATGQTGDTGPVGPKGDTGMQGDTGPVGPKGDTGVQGDAGPVGPKGDTGSQGPPGPPGSEGKFCIAKQQFQGVYLASIAM